MPLHDARFTDLAQNDKVNVGQLVQGATILKEWSSSASAAIRGALAERG
jgi:hypothetical protein